MATFSVLALGFAFTLTAGSAGFVANASAATTATAIITALAIIAAGHADTRPLVTALKIGATQTAGSPAAIIAALPIVALRLTDVCSIGDVFHVGVIIVATRK